MVSVIPDVSVQYSSKGYGWKRFPVAGYSHLVLESWIAAETLDNTNIIRKIQAVSSTVFFHNYYVTVLVYVAKNADNIKNERDEKLHILEVILIGYSRHLNIMNID